MTEVFVGLGSNVGDRAGNLRAAVSQLAGKLPVCKVSSVWETESIPPGQPAFLNAAVRVEFEGEPEELLRMLQSIEHSAGRRRPGPRWAPRTLDLDILLFGDLSVSSDELTVPHPRMFERAFVLAPLLEVVDGGSELALRCQRELAKLGLAGVRKTQEALLERP